MGMIDHETELSRLEPFDDIEGITDTRITVGIRPDRNCSNTGTVQVAVPHVVAPVFFGPKAIGGDGGASDRAATFVKHADMSQRSRRREQSVKEEHD
jgi:hypothetical protein